MIIKGKRGLKVETIEYECEEILSRITALTSLLKAADRSRVSDDDMFWVLSMIEEHIPDRDLVISN